MCGRFYKQKSPLLGGACVHQICVHYSTILDISVIKSDIVETEKPLTEIKGFITVGVERFELPTSSL